MKHTNEYLITDNSEFQNKKLKIVDYEDEILNKFNCSDFYIDKTLLIKDFLQESSKIVCVTRPSNHGKTVILKMMRSFFEMNYEEENMAKNRYLFEKLNIAKELKNGKSYLDCYQGKFPVVFLNFDSFIIGESFEETIENFKTFIQGLFKKYESIKIENLSKYSKDKWERIQNHNADTYDLKNSIGFLCECLKELLKKKVLLLIDDYDLPILKALNTSFFNKFYSFYKNILINIFKENDIYDYLFKTFITGKIDVQLFENFNSKNYSVRKNKYNEYYSITDSELKIIISEFNLENEKKIFKKFCNINSIPLSFVNPSNFNNTNIIFSHNNYINNNNHNIPNINNLNNNNNNNDNDGNRNNNNNPIKYYDLLCVKNYVVSGKLENTFISKKYEIFSNIKKTGFFDYVMIKDIDYILQKGFIEKSIPRLLDFEELLEDNIKKNPKIIWSLFIKNGYFVVDSINDIDKIKIRNEEIKDFIRIEFSKLKSHFYEKYKNIINLFIKNYDEEEIEKSLEKLINNDCNYQSNVLINYYYLIWSLLSLNDQYIVVTKENFNKNGILEILYFKKNNLAKLNDNFDHSNNSQNIISKNNLSDIYICNYDNNDNNNNNSENCLYYIAIKYIFETNIMENECIQVLNNNPNFVFNGIELKKIYNKIIKFGFAINENNCEVIYEINYGDNFKRKEMPKLIYSGEIFNSFAGNNYYFIDKTRMISKLIEQKEASYLITRPRRFGKSLNLRMVKEFFEKPDYKNSRGNDLFDGLEVSRDRKNMRDFHKYPVIYLNFKDDESQNYDSAIRFIKIKVVEVFEYHKNRINFQQLKKKDQEKWNEIENEETIKSLENPIEDSICFLMKCLKNFYKRNCIVLIDEYDKIIINSLENNFYKEINSRFKSMISSLFKGNDYLHFGILTGCLDIGLQGIFSGFNNFYKSSLLYDNFFSDCYGFTENELDNILSHFGFSESVKEIIRKKYNGYSCISTSLKGIVKNMYNPYSITFLISDNTPPTGNYTFNDHWANSGTDSTLKKIISIKNYDILNEFMELINENIINVEIKENLNINDNLKDYSKKISKSEIWHILLFSGYITIIDEIDCSNQKKNQKDKQEDVKKLSNKKRLIEKNSINDIKKFEEKLNNEKNDLDVKEYSIKIPNKEILKCFIDLNNYYLNNILNKVFEENKTIKSCVKEYINGFFDKNVEKINENLTEFLKIFSPYQLFTKFNVNENVYQALLMGMFSLFNVKNITTEEHSGYGRYDFGFPHRNNTKKKEYILIEIKTYIPDDKHESKNKNSKKNIKKNKHITEKEKIKNKLQKECEESIKQIEEKDYAAKFRVKGYKSFIKYGVVFYKKYCKVAMKIDDDKIQNSCFIYNNNNDSNKNYDDSDINNNYRNKNYDNGDINNNNDSNKNYDDGDINNNNSSSSSSSSNGNNNNEYELNKEKSEIVKNNIIDELFETCKQPERYKDLINIFYENIIDVNVTKNEMTPLQVASENGNIKAVEYFLLLNKIDIDAGHEGYTAVELAYKNEHYKVAELLLKKKIEKSERLREENKEEIKKNKKNNVIDELFEACKQPDKYKDLINIFNENIIDVNVRKNEMTPLQVASQNGNLRAVEYLLLLKGIDIDVGESGYTSFELANRNGHYKVAELLLQKKLEKSKRVREADEEEIKNRRRNKRNKKNKI